VIDLDKRALIATIPTGGKARTDFVVYDPDHHIVLATKDRLPVLCQLCQPVIPQSDREA
jgi:hypothetical protein